MNKFEKQVEFKRYGFVIEVNNVYTYYIARVAVGMGIPTGFPYGWEWEFILAYGNSHMWESCGNSEFPMWESYGNYMGIPTEILWEWDGN